MKPGSLWRLDFTPADTQTTTKSSEIAGSPSSIYLLIFLYECINSYAKWFVSVKSHSTLCSHTSVLTVFWCVSQQKEAVSQRCQWGCRGGRGRFISVFEKEVNNNYSLTCQQHNICSVTLRWRNASSEKATSRLRTMKNVTWGCIP